MDKRKGFTLIELERTRRLILIGAVLAGTGLLLALVLPAVRGLPLVRRTMIETLHAPVQIRDLDADGLVTADGKVIRLRYVKQIPASNTIFAAVTAQGVELDPNGRAVGLIDVHHWCGNDPVGKHLARVDLAALALYLGAEPTEDAPDFVAELPPRVRTTGRIDPGDYGIIRTITIVLEEE